MKLTKLAIAASMAVASSSVFALAPNAIDPMAPGANDVVIHYAGATAQKETATALAGDFCAAGTMDRFDNASGETHLTITCTMDNAAPVPASLQGKNLYFSYYLGGGSIYGVTPVIDQITLNNMKVFGGTCSEITPDNWTCVNDTTSPAQAPGANQYAAAPIAGGSDVEPALFKGSNVVGLDFAAPVGANFVTSQAFNVIFGLAVNCDLLDNTEYPDCAGSVNGPLKSLSKTSAASILASNGKVVWEQIPEFGNVDTDGNGSTQMNDLLLGSVGGTQIDVCRRLPGSGTQASAQAYFVKQECGAPERGFVATATDGARIHEFSSSTKILTQCVDVTPTAIGISSVEKEPHRADNKYGNNWDYIKINGLAPTLQNAATGAYDYVYENSMQYHTTAAGASQQTFITAMFDRAKESAGLVGKPGVMGIPDGVINLPADLTDSNGNGDYSEVLASNPVAWTSRDGLACKQPVQLFP